MDLYGYKLVSNNFFTVRKKKFKKIYIITKQLNIEIF